MSAYNGRRAPNVSQYVQNLNTVPSAHDMASQSQDGLVLDDALAMFTNSEFFDFVPAEMTATSQPVPEYDQAQEERTTGRNNAIYNNDGTAVDFLNGGFQFPDFSDFTAVVPDPALNGLPAPQPAPYPLGQLPSPPAASPVPAVPTTGQKRKLDAISAPHNPPAGEEAARLAAEEDKRRRNTAASARFRIKKKQREQALEETAKEMTAKVSVLETRVQQLEMENQLLKSLIMEKGGVKPDMTELYKKFAKDHSESRSTGERNDGVGTVGADGEA